MKINRWLWDSIAKNSSNIFGFIGIISTIYFGVFHVPSWIKEYRISKLALAEQDIHQSIKELVFHDSLLSESEILLLIQAKELEISESFPNSPKQMLTKVQGSFMEDRFIPLDKRKILIKKIENIKGVLSNDPIKEEVKGTGRGKIYDSIMKILAALTSLFIAIVGFAGLYKRSKTEKEKDEEIKNQAYEIETAKIFINKALEYEDMIATVLSNRFDSIKITEASDSGFDIKFEHEGIEYFIEAKYLNRSRVGVGSVDKFLNSVKGIEGKFIFIYNTELTEMAKRRLTEFINMKTGNREIIAIKAENKAELEKELEKL